MLNDNGVNPVMDFTANGFKIKNISVWCKQQWKYSYSTQHLQKNPFKNALAR
jgi:hypothetical protein